MSIIHGVESILFPFINKNRNKNKSQKKSEYSHKVEMLMVFLIQTETNQALPGKKRKVHSRAQPQPITNFVPHRGIYYFLMQDPFHIASIRCLHQKQSLKKYRQQKRSQWTGMVISCAEGQMEKIIRHTAGGNVLYWLLCFLSRRKWYWKKIVQHSGNCRESLFRNCRESAKSA